MKEKLNIIRESLRQHIYETTCGSPLEDDGSHKCKISAKALSDSRKSLAILDKIIENQKRLTLVRGFNN